MFHKEQKYERKTFFPHNYYFSIYLQKAYVTLVISESKLEKATQVCDIVKMTCVKTYFDKKIALN